MSSNPVITTVDVLRVAPSPDSAAQLSLPLTSFDMTWLKAHPVQRIFFYKLPQSTPTFFNSVLIPQLKHSLSVTLTHFLPLAGNLIWPPHSAVPVILFTPNDGAVSVTVAESTADFHRLSALGAHRPVVESYPYIPDLEVSDSKASVLSLQITNFPNQGFCVGFSSHHAVMDGKSFTMFIKTWAFICKQAKAQAHPPNLTTIPCYDRTVIAAHDPVKMDPTTPRSLSLNPAEPTQEDQILAIFQLSSQEIARLKGEITKTLTVDDHHRAVKVSSLAAVLAYTVLSWLKEKPKQEARRPILLGIPADFRGRLNPPLPANYFGTCLELCLCEISEEDLEGIDDHYRWVSLVANKITDAIRELDQFDKEAFMRKLVGEPGVDRHVIGVAGSTRFELYDTDFGWGKPVKVEVTSIAETGVVISLAESGDGDGGVEVGLCLNKPEMEAFQEFFSTGLKALV